MDERFQEIFQRLDQCTKDTKQLKRLGDAFLDRAMDICVETGRDYTKIKARKKEDIPIEIHTKTGTIINEARACLDSCVNALADRNGYHDSKISAFPMSEDANRFRDNGRRQISELPAADQTKISNLQPIGDTNPKLFAFHQYDVSRKHRRLGVHVPATDGFGVTPHSKSRTGTISNDFLRPVIPIPEIQKEWTHIYNLKTKTGVRLKPNWQIVFCSPDQINGVEIIKGLTMLIADVCSIVGQLQ